IQESDNFRQSIFPSGESKLILLYMQIHELHRRDTGLFSQQQLDLCYNQNAFIPFIREAFSMEGFENGISLRSDQFTPHQRTALHSALREQYAAVSNAEESLANIDRLLKPTTFTVTTGHQLSAFTG